MEVKPVLLFFLAFATFPISTDAECEYSYLSFDFLTHTKRESTEKECKDMCAGLVFCLIWQWQPNRKICWLIRAQIKFDVESTIGINNCKDCKPLETAPVCEVKKGDKQLTYRRYRTMSKADCKQECTDKCIMWQHTKEWCKIYKLEVDETKASLVGIHYCSSTSSVTTNSPGTCVPCGVVDNANSRRASKIVGGAAVAEEGKYPFQVYIKIGNGMCGGSIISQRSILTAAHCTRGKKISEIFVHVGKVNVDEMTDWISVQRIREHPDYNRDGKNENDIAVLTLSKTLEYTDNVKKVCLPFGSSSPFGSPSDGSEYEDVEHTAIGWGSTGTFEGSSKILKEVGLKTMTNNVCIGGAQTYGGPLFGVNSDQMCAFGVSVGICMGDSGGPLFMYDDKGRILQTGITSAVPSHNGHGVCNDQKFQPPSIFTRTSSHLAFIWGNMILDCPFSDQ